MKEKIKFSFHGRDEVLKIIDTGGNLVEYLSTRTDVCPLLGSEIKFVKKLGKGKSGIAFLIKIKDMGEKEYVAKKETISEKTIHQNIHHTTTLEKVAKQYEKKEMIPSKTFILFNGGNPNLILYPGEYIFNYPKYFKTCLTSKLEKFERLDGKGYISIPKGSYLCDIRQVYSEYVIGILLGNLYRSGISANFLDVFGFASCPSKDGKLNQYIFMEKANKDLYDIAECISQRYTPKKYFRSIIIESLFVQCLHAIAVYQKYYKIQHNDLKLDNIMTEYINENSEYGGKSLYGVDWFHYRIYDTDIYLPWTPVLAKIGDLGLSVKYKSPVIGPKLCIETGLNTGDGEGPWVPNWYCKNSDAIFMVSEFYSHNPENEFIRNIFGWMLGSNDKNLSGGWFKKEVKFNFTSGGSRPSIDSLSGKYKRGTPENILQNNRLMGKYLKKPKKGKIVTLGIIE